MNICQAHICRLAGDHRPGLECLSDGQLLPILLAMDPDALLSCGRANRRLHRLVCDMSVWRHLLRGIETFTYQRLVELAEFGKKNSCLEMMTAEVVKEVASRFKISLGSNGQGNSVLFCFKKGMKLHFTNSFKVAVSIQGWGAPVTFEMGGEHHLKELNQVAQTVGAKFTIKEVEAFADFRGYPYRSWHGKSFELMAGLVAQQGEGLHKLELAFVSLCSYSQVWDTCLSLLKASEEWKIQTLSATWQGFSNSGGDIWTELARNAASGHIGTMKFLIYKGMTARTSKEDMKAVWEIAETLEVEVIDRGTLIRIGGGRGEDPKTTWEEAYDTVLNNIC